MVRKLVDVLFLIALGAFIFLGLQMCSRKTTLRPREQSCLKALQAGARKDTNFTRDEVVSYGRCILENRTED